MKIQAIAALCKKRKKISSFQVGETQFVGTGTAYYSLGDIPYMDANALCELFGLKDGERDKWEVDCYTGNLFFENMDEEELEARGMGLGLCTAGREYAALLNEDGIQYLDTEYLKPVSDSRILKFMIRKTGAAPCVLVFDSGENIREDILLAYILTSDINTETFLSTLKRMALEMEKYLNSENNE